MPIMKMLVGENVYITGEGVIKMKKLVKNYLCKICKKDGKVDRLETNKKQRFYNYVRTIKWGNSILKAYVRVSYGRHTDCFGKTSAFHNEGNYYNKEDFIESLKAFDELENKDFYDKA